MIYSSFYPDLGTIAMIDLGVNATAQETLDKVRQELEGLKSEIILLKNLSTLVGTRQIKSLASR